MKFISPGGWLSIELPKAWNEFEDTAESFLFYNPEKWNGNFRISAYKDKSDRYADECMKDELKANPDARMVKVGNWDCAYSSETFQEDGEWYTTHIWITGKADMSIECSFTINKGGEISVAHDIISSISIRDNKQKEIIPARVMEIEEINSGFEWTVTHIKKELSKDFTSEEKDLCNIQKLMDSGKFNPKQKDPWEAFAMAFGAIVINEMDGTNWMTVVDGKNEYPVLQFKDTDIVVDPVQMIWSKIKNGEKCNLQDEFDSIAAKISDSL